MSFNGAGLFQINSVGQPVVFNTTIDETVFNAFTADIATGLSTCITKDGQTTVTGNIPMGGYKFTNLGLGTAVTDAARVDNANSSINEFRLTLTTGVPVTTSDVTAAETVYWTPYKGSRVALFDGTSWHMRTSAELSIDVPDATNCYDVFVYDNAGVATLELTAWTNITTRATALTYQDGVLSKTGALTRRYVGTFYCTTAGNGQTNDAVAGRYLWNYYNRTLRSMRALEATVTWNYTTATIRQANGSNSNQLNFVVGVSEDVVSASLSVTLRNTNVGVLTVAGIGLDTTSAFTATGVFGGIQTAVANTLAQIAARWSGLPGVGVHALSWNEYSAATGTTTWAGNDGFGFTQNGIVGEILA